MANNILLDNASVKKQVADDPQWTGVFGAIGTGRQHEQALGVEIGEQEKDNTSDASDTLDLSKAKRPTLLSLSVSLIRLVRFMQFI